MTWMRGCLLISKTWSKGMDPVLSSGDRRKPIMDAMSLSHGELTHVSDTARMVAACRALESECPDGFVHDPLAARLAGEHG